jgi:predicted transposase YdaD
VGEWDDTLKRLFMAEPQDMVSWLIPGAIYVERVSLEIKLTPELQARMEMRTRNIDILYKVIINGKEALLHIEFQKTVRSNMAKRVWEYNVMASLMYEIPVYSVVIYLTATGNVPASPLEWGLDEFEKIHIFRFRNIKLAEIDLEEFIRTGLLGVLPMCILTRDGRAHEKAAELFTRLKDRRDLLTLALTLASMVYTTNEDLDWLRKQVEMMEDMITDTWFYQHILNRGRDEGRAEGRDEGLEALQQAVISIIQAHFPELTQQAQKVVSQVTDFQQLQQLNLDLYIARDAAEVTQLLSALANYADS